LLAGSPKKPTTEKGGGKKPTEKKVVKKQPEEDDGLKPAAKGYEAILKAIAAEGGEKTRTAQLGFGQDPFEDTLPEGGLLIGLEVGQGMWPGPEQAPRRWRVIQSVRPIYRTAKRRILG